MTTRVQRDIAEIKNTLLQMSALAEESVRTAVQAWQNHDQELASRVIERDWEIDKIEVQVDSLILKTLVLQQPMAADLRFLTSAMQIAEQLERVGDHSVNIAEQVKSILQRVEVDTVPSTGLKEIAARAIKMLGDSINAFVYADPDLAREVLTQDRDVDELYASVVGKEIDKMEVSPGEVRPGVYHIILALNLERIADLATNIAEDVIFLVEGRLMRHGMDEEYSLDHGRETDEPLPEEGVCPAPESKRREPLECLENHAKRVTACFEAAARAIKAHLDGDSEEFKRLAEEASEMEHAADLISRNVRSHLPKGIIMPIDKFELFLYLKEEDDVADTAEDVLEWLTYHDSIFPSKVKKELIALVNDCLEITNALVPMIHAARTYFQTGDEEVRNHVKDRIRHLRSMEHDADVREHGLKKEIFAQDLPPLTTYHLIHLVELVGESADHAEKAADILRSMIAR